MQSGRDSLVVPRFLTPVADMTYIICSNHLQLIGRHWPHGPQGFFVSPHMPATVYHYGSKAVDKQRAAPRANIA